MVALTTIAVVALIILAWRRHAWSIAVLGVIVGVTLSGPAADLVEAGMAGAKTAATNVDRVTRTGTR